MLYYLDFMSTIFAPDIIHKTPNPLDFSFTEQICFMSRVRDVWLHHVAEEHSFP